MHKSQQKSDSNTKCFLFKYYVVINITIQRTTFIVLLNHIAILQNAKNTSIFLDDIFGFRSYWNVRQTAARARVAFFKLVKSTLQNGYMV